MKPIRYCRNCESAASISQIRINSSQYCVQCVTCGESSPVRGSREEALDAWNEIQGGVEPPVFQPHWPEGLKAREFYRVLCDDKGSRGGTWLQVMIDDQGDVYVSMQDWERIPEGRPRPLPSIRVRTAQGGGRNKRTRQALLWLAEAIRLDNVENGVTDQN